MTRIHAPQLDRMRITFNSIDFDCPQLAKFINRTPTLRALDTAHVKFDDHSSNVVLLGRPPEIRISCVSGLWHNFDRDWCVSFVVQVCNSLPTPSPVKDLHIEYECEHTQLWTNDAIGNTPWLQLLLPFTAVKNLCLSEEVALGIAVALQELVGARITEVLPSLQNIFVGELGSEPLETFQENIGKFVAARRLSGHPVAVLVGKEPVQNDGEEGEESAL